MGARVQVKIIDSVATPPVYLYAHWGAGGETLQSVHAAMCRGVRWGDAEYLARIIFETMILSELGQETGHGIGTGLHGDVEELIVVDTLKQRVCMTRGYGSTISDVDEGTVTGCPIDVTFKEFVGLNLKEIWRKIKS